MRTIDQQLTELEPQWAELVRELIPQIRDDYWALTIGFTPETETDPWSWHYQTGDNSYTGGAYGHRHWAVVYLPRESDPLAIAKDIADQLGDLVWQSTP